LEIKHLMQASCKKFRRRDTLFAGFLLLLPTTTQAEWNQWRGSQRNGIATDTTPITSSFPKDGPPELWKSEPIPSDHDGGHSSLVVSGERLFLPVVWHTANPSEKRLIDGEVLASLGHRGTQLLGPELTARMEAARHDMPRLRGAALEEWARTWVKENFSEEQRLVLGSWAESRFKQGKQAIDLAILERLNKPPKRPFDNSAELNAWLDELNLDPAVRDRFIKAVPTTIKSAEDVVLCLDAKTGGTLWKFTAEGVPTGRSNASTCAVADDHVYAVLSTHLYALDAGTGKLIWKTPVSQSGKGSSPLYADGKIYLLEGSLMCVNASDGQILWSNKETKGTNSSPILWKTSDGLTTLVCQTNNQLTGHDPATGAVRWKAEGGGQSTPVAQDDYLVILSSAKGVGLRCYLAQPNSPPKVHWTHNFLAARYSSSPLIHNNEVYLLGSSRHLCLDLSDGKVHWENQIESTISSPILVDGKLLILDNNGSHLNLLKATPESYQSLGRARIGAMWCPTPTPWNGRVIIRKKDHVACYDLRESTAP
jgi:hypothetical protein